MYLICFQELKLSKEQKKTQDFHDSQKRESDEIRKLKIANENLLSEIDDIKDTVSRVRNSYHYFKQH